MTILTLVFHLIQEQRFSVSYSPKSLYTFKHQLIIIHVYYGKIIVCLKIAYFCA